jgi:hypothetical protein
MTAHELIAQWYQRPQAGVVSNMRFITVAQIDLLRDLIGEDEEGAAVERGMGRSFVWKPSGRNKYVVTEGQGGKRNTILKLANVVPSAAGSLFADQGNQGREVIPETER